MGQQVVIVEGPDGVGKTHVALELASRLGIPYFKSGAQRVLLKEKGDFKAELEHGESRQIDLIMQLDLSLVQDRGYPSEFVYSAVYGRPTNPWALSQADKFYASMDTTIILCLMRDYASARPDDLVKAQDLVTIHEAYEKFAEATACRTVMLHVDDLGRDIDREMDYIAGCTGWPISNR